VGGAARVPAPSVDATLTADYETMDEMEKSFQLAVSSDVSNFARMQTRAVGAEEELDSDSDDDSDSDAITEEDYAALDGEEEEDNALVSRMWKEVHAPRHALRHRFRASGSGSTQSQSGSSWQSCADQCPGENAVVKALEAGKPTPKCCVDLLYETTVYVDRLLTRNNITYWAMKGTLLGIVREKGIIPHDYDIDIGMLHEDINKVASLRKQILQDGYLLLQAPWTGYNNMNFVIVKQTAVVREWLKRWQRKHGDQRPQFEKSLRKAAISAELMVFKDMNGVLVQLLCTAEDPKNPDLYVGTVSETAYTDYEKDKKAFDARRASETDGWLKYANQKDGPWRDYHKKFDNNRSPKCQHTAPASFRYDVPTAWVLPPKRSKYFSYDIFVPKEPEKYAESYFGKDYMTPKRRYGGK